MRIPDNISREHMLMVIERMDAGELLVPPVRRSTKYCLIHEGRHYAPKEVVRQANVVPNRKELWGFGGGKKRTTPFCKSRGFRIDKHGRAPH